MLIALIALALQAPPALSPEEERASFKLPAGFSIELVCAEPEVKKIVDVAFDDAGRMWATTACEYPRDANEDPRALDIYRGGGRDQVLVFDAPTRGERLTPRVFAEGLAMPMSVLPLDEGAIVQHGTEILLLSDTDGDGRADLREVLLSGFGVQDSHLMPHRFLRGPGGWIYTAQGAFNYSLVRDRWGRETRFDQCKLARFRRDGSRFEIVAAGLNNIWGIVFDRRGDFFIQEANDLGYSVVPLVRDASYPGIGMARIRACSPWQPPLATFRLGGSGLSGLALSESSQAFPAPFDAALLVANPIERKVQSVRVKHGGVDPLFEPGPDLISSSDARFRPIAVHFGPDECLYVVDWYNPVISHNEVPRTDPERDRVRSRVWRVRHRDQPRVLTRDMTRAGPVELFGALASPRTWESRAAWHQLVDRRLGEFVPQLRLRALDRANEIGPRMLAIWTLEGLGAIDAELVEGLLADTEPALGRDALRGFAANGASEAALLAWREKIAASSDAQLRAEWIRALDALPEPSSLALDALIAFAKPPLAGPTVACEQNGESALLGAAHQRAFERFLLQKALEDHAKLLRERVAAGALPADEGATLAASAIGGAEGARLLANSLSRLSRAPLPAELALLASHADLEAAASMLKVLLATSAGARDVILALSSQPASELPASLRERIVFALRGAKDPALTARAAMHWQLGELADALAAALEQESTPRSVAVDCVRALALLHSTREELFERLARGAIPGDELQTAVLEALASAGTAGAAEVALAVMPDTTPAARAATAQTLALSQAGARALLAAVAEKRIAASVLDARTREALRATLGEDPLLSRVLEAAPQRSLSVLVIPGGRDDYVASQLELAGAFTLEAWIELDAGITNQDGLLAAPGVFDWNFADARLRLWQGPKDGDVIIARRTVEPGRWTHVALTRSVDGVLRQYQDGELDVESAPLALRPFSGLDIGRTTPGGCAARIVQMRVWNVARGPLEIATDRARIYDGARPKELLLVVPGDPLAMHGAAAIAPSSDLPKLSSDAELEAERALFERYARLSRGGDSGRGQPIFARTCQVCHAISGKGETVGPPLDGAGLRGKDGLLAAILHPSAALESGYRLLRIELSDESVIEGLLVSEDETSLTLRAATSAGAQPARRIPRKEIRRTRWSDLSVMPDGLLQSLPDDDAANLLAFLAAQR